MRDGPDIVLVASLMGDPARANMLTSLMGGQALTAGELAYVAGVTAQTASGHLAQLLDGGLLDIEKQGRHRYYRLAGADVAVAVEALMNVAEQADRRHVRPGPNDAEMRHARVCYDHLAGTRGVELFARMSRRRLIALDSGALEITPRGEAVLGGFGIDLSAAETKRPPCRTCLDWSERKTHLAGALGARLLGRFFELDWMRRVGGSRAVRFTPLGDTEFSRLFIGRESAAGDH